MIDYKLHRETGILVVHPSGVLEAADFEKLSADVDAYIEAENALKGLIIVAGSFPGWKDIKGLMAHFHFIHDHHRKIAKVAFVSDSTLVKTLPEIARHFVSAEVKHFDAGEEAAAMSWIQNQE